MFRNVRMELVVMAAFAGVAAFGLAAPATADGPLFNGEMFDYVFYSDSTVGDWADRLSPANTCPIYTWSAVSQDLAPRVYDGTTPTIMTDVTSIGLKLDLFVPVAQDHPLPEKLPGMVIGPGGGLMWGEPREAWEWGAEFAKRGYVCACIDRRQMQNFPPEPPANEKALKDEVSPLPAFVPTLEHVYTDPADEESEITLWEWFQYVFGPDAYSPVTKTMSSQMERWVLNAIEAEVEDTTKAVRWMCGEDFGAGTESLRDFLDANGHGDIVVDPGRVAAGGHCAGGILSAFAAYKSYEPAPVAALWWVPGSLVGNSDELLASADADAVPLIAFHGNADTILWQDVAKETTDRLEQVGAPNRFLSLQLNEHGVAQGALMADASSCIASRAWANGPTAEVPAVEDLVADFLYVHMDLAGLTSEVDQTRAFRFCNEAGDPLMTLDAEGNLVVRGRVTESATSELLPTAEKELIIRNAGGVLARLSAAGNLYLKGQVYEDVAPSTFTNANVPVSMRIKDGAGTTVSLINSSAFTPDSEEIPAGSLLLTGKACVGDEPDLVLNTPDDHSLSCDYFLVDLWREETTDPTVVVVNSCADTSLPPTTCVVTETPDAASLDWQPYTSVNTFALSPGYGPKSVYFKVKNQNNEESRWYRDAITYTAEEQ